MSPQLSSPSPIVPLLAELRRTPSSSSCEVLARAQVELELRHIWQEVHTHAGQEGRAKELRLEMLALMVEIDEAVHRRLGQQVRFTAPEA